MLSAHYYKTFSIVLQIFSKTCYLCIVCVDHFVVKQRCFVRSAVDLCIILSDMSVFFSVWEPLKMLSAP